MSHTPCSSAQHVHAVDQMSCRMHAYGLWSIDWSMRQCDATHATHTGSDGTRTNRAPIQFFPRMWVSPSPSFTCTCTCPDARPVHPCPDCIALRIALLACQLGPRRRHSISSTSLVFVSSSSVRAERGNRSTRRSVRNVTEKMYLRLL